MKSKKSSSRILTLNNLLGLLIASLIVFDVKMSLNMTQFVNSPLGIVIAIIVIIVMFVFMHPILGLLVIVYLYENVKHVNKMFSKMRPSHQAKDLSVMKKMNKSSYNAMVEEEVVNKMAPIIKKRENPNAKFLPSTYDNEKGTLV
jgi:hypothetical protein